MTSRHLVLAELIIVASSTIVAQNVSVVTYSVGSFGHDHSFIWSQDSNVGLMVAPVVGEEIRSRTREQLENVGLSLVAQDDPQPAPVLVRLRCSNSAGPTPLILAIELYDRQSQAMIWRGEAKPVLNQGDMRATLLIVDRNIAKMFEHFPYHLNGWISATRR
jgi:hypothetical protein